MPTYNTLTWHNENALSSHPFGADIEPRSFIVDAKFVQFDNYIPSLNYIQIQPDSIHLVLTFDHGLNTTSTLLKSAYLSGDEYQLMRIYTPDGLRYLGVITFGVGAAELWTDYVGRKLQYNIPFLPTTVISIPSSDAVYTFDSNYGDISLSRTSVDSTIFYNTSLELNSLVFNAVAGHAVPTDQVQVGIKQINHVKPANNNINLASNDVIKVSSTNSASLTIELVSGAPSAAFQLPTLTV
jgi:hypothetical protein